jgi:hypothetical protein
VLITPMLGVDRDALRRCLQDVTNRLSTVSGGGNQLLDYLRWVSDATRVLRTVIRPADLAKTVLTRRHEVLLSMIDGSQAPSPQRQENNAVISSLVGVEVEERLDALRAAITELDAQVVRWTARTTTGEPPRFIALDTKVYVEHENKVKDLDFAELVGARGGPIFNLLPMVVVDELDNLKRSGDEHTRWRAVYTTAVLNETFTSGGESQHFRPADFSPLDHGGIPRGEVYFELLPDPVGHSRLPIPDDEVVDRLAAVRPIIGQQITVVTFDTGQAMRARLAGLDVRRLELPRRNEPKPRWDRKPGT